MITNHNLNYQSHHPTHSSGPQASQMNGISKSKIMSANHGPSSSIVQARGSSDQFWQLIDDVVKHLDVAINDLSPDRDLSAINSIESLLSNQETQNGSSGSQGHRPRQLRQERAPSLDMDPLESLMQEIQMGTINSNSNSNSGSGWSGSTSESSRGTPLSLCGSSRQTLGSTSHQRPEPQRKMSDEDNTKVMMLQTDSTSQSGCEEIQSCFKSDTCSGGGTIQGEGTFYDQFSDSPLPVEMPLYERLIRTQAIWFLPRLSRGHVIHLLTGKEPGLFIVRGSSSPGHHYALSVRLPESTGGPHVEHYLIELDEKKDGDQQSSPKFHLEGSDFNFPSIPSLVQHYAIICDELPVALNLPPVLTQATRTHLTSIALLGQDFWSSGLAAAGAVYRQDSSRSPTAGHECASNGLVSGERKPKKVMVDRGCSPTPSPYPASYPVLNKAGTSTQENSGHSAASELLNSADASPIKRSKVRMVKNKMSSSETNGSGTTSSTASYNASVAVSPSPLPPPIPPKRDVSDLELHLKSIQNQDSRAEPPAPPLPPKKRTSIPREHEGKTAESFTSAGSVNLIELSSPPAEITQKPLQEVVQKVVYKCDKQTHHKNQHHHQQGEYEDIWSLNLLERLSLKSNARKETKKVIPKDTCQEVTQSGVLAVSAVVPAAAPQVQPLPEPCQSNRKSTHSTHSTETVNSFQVIWTPSEPTLVTDSTQEILQREEDDNHHTYLYPAGLDLALGEIYAEPADAIPTSNSLDVEKQDGHHSIPSATHGNRLSRHYSDSDLPESSRTSYALSDGLLGGDDFEFGSGSFKTGFKTLDDMYDNMRANYEQQGLPPPLPASRPPTKATRLSLESLLSHIRSPISFPPPTFYVPSSKN